MWVAAFVVALLIAYGEGIYRRWRATQSEEPVMPPLAPDSEELTRLHRLEANAVAKHRWQENRDDKERTGPYLFPTYSVNADGYEIISFRNTREVVARHVSVE